MQRCGGIDLNLPQSEASVAVMLPRQQFPDRHADTSGLPDHEQCHPLCGGNESVYPAGKGSDAQVQSVCGVARRGNYLYCRDQSISLFPDRTKEAGEDAGTCISYETVEKVPDKELAEDQIISKTGCS